MRLSVSLFLSTLAAAAVVAADDQCGLYLAVSSTSTVDEPKWGLFAGVDMDKNAVIGPPDMAIQTFDLMGNNRAANEDEDTYEQNIVQFFEQFIWVPDCSGGKWELGKGRCVTAIPGAGVLGGFNVKLTNADWDHSMAYFREALGEQAGVTHPGRGAYSGFFNVGLRSKESITAGSEIFMDYGENWAEEAEEEEDEELTKLDYKKVDIMVDQMIEFLDTYKEELTETSKAEIYDFLVKDVMGAAAGAKKGRKITSILPSDPADLPKVKEAGGSLMYSVPSSKRPLDWLKNNGRCLDNIEAKASTIPYAGRGAFATRAIAEGSLVSPVPLIHIPNKAALDMYEVTSSSSDEDSYRHRVNDEMIGSQLLLNYCYGHPESTMVFFPSGSAALFINHSKEKTNAKLVWSEHSEHKKDWYDLKPSDLVETDNQYIGLMMEIIATKDIAPGEEVFLDYGDEWDAAWDRHVEEFNEKVENGSVVNPWPIRALDLNEEYRSKAYKTEQEKEPYPDHIVQKCFLTVAEAEDEDEDSTPTWKAPEKTSPYITDNLFECTIKARNETEDGNFEYTVEWINKYKESEIVEKVPHRAIIFLDKPGTSDQFFHGAFRHYIGIPDEIFPEGVWRNLV